MESPRRLVYFDTKIIIINRKTRLDLGMLVLTQFRKPFEDYEVNNKKQTGVTFHSLTF